MSGLFQDDFQFDLPDGVSRLEFAVNKTEGITY